MANYKVLSDNFAGRQAGDTVTDEDLDGLNVEALIAAGHLADGSTKASKAEKE